MPLQSIHVLLTYRCTDVCRHCFVFGSPNQMATFTAHRLRKLLEQVHRVPGIRWVFFEGGEPFLYYPLLLEAVAQASELGLATAVVTNGFWVTSEKDIGLYLRPLGAAGLKKIQFSVDGLHRYRRLDASRDAIMAACRFHRITAEIIGISLPVANAEPGEARNGAVILGGAVAFRGRAATLLADDQALWLWSSFDHCPHERLGDPTRVHVDPHGGIHVCQGTLIGSTENRDLMSAIAEYRPSDHPIVRPLLKGGPAALITEYGLAHEEGYADACHLCYHARSQLLERFREHLGPPGVYGSLEKGRRLVESASQRPAHGAELVPPSEVTSGKPAMQ